MRRWGTAVLTIGVVALAGAGCSSSSDEGVPPSKAASTTSAARTTGLQVGSSGVPDGKGSFKLDGAYVHAGQEFVVMCTVSKDKTSVLTAGVAVRLEITNATPQTVTKFDYLPANGVLRGDPSTFRVTHDGDATVVSGSLSGTLLTDGGGMDDVTKAFEFRYTC